MSLFEEIRADLKASMKSRDMGRLGTLRLLVSAFDYVDKQTGEFGEEEQMAVMKSEAKKRREAMEAYEKAGQSDRAEQEAGELRVIEKYLPEQVGEEEVRKVVTRLIKEQGAEVNRGQLIGRVIGEIGREKVDGNMVAKVVGDLL